MPEDDRAEKYETTTQWKRLVSQYTLLNFLQIGELNYVRFLALRRDAFIDQCRRTETGQKYLDNAWRMEQTEPDRKELRKQFGRKETTGDGGQIERPDD